MSPAAILNGAADLIEPEGAWTRGAWAKTAGGRTIGPQTENAVCWCAAGAIIRTSGTEVFSYREAALALRTTIGGTVAEWNDDPNRTQAEVMAALRAAAKLAEAT